VSLDLSRLEKVRHRGAKVEARCPACAENGGDKTGNHLMIGDGGKFACIMFPGDAGDGHRKRIFELAGERAMTPRPLPLARSAVITKASPRLPDLRALTAAEMGVICDRRGWLETTALKHLTRRGLLWFGKVWDDGVEWPAWIITDSSRRNAQARRIDGKPWQGIGAKAKTLPGCDPSWPIGAADIGSRPFVLFCEGGPDFLASLYVAGWEGLDPAMDSIAPVCMAGAGNLIHPEALALFAGKRVRICVHDDGAGAGAGHRWAKQLRQGGATVDGFSFAGLVLPDGETPCKDLADFSRLFDSGEAPAVKLTASLIN
jgi:hypothetical protein